MPDYPKLLADVQRALNALASALDASPQDRVVREQASDDEKLLALIASRPDQPWRVYRIAFGAAWRADGARSRLLLAGRLKTEIYRYVDSLGRRQQRNVLVIAEREKAPEGAPRRILPPGF